MELKYSDKLPYISNKAPIIMAIEIARKRTMFFAFCLKVSPDFHKMRTGMKTNDAADGILQSEATADATAQIIKNFLLPVSKNSSVEITKIVTNSIVCLSHPIRVIFKFLIVRRVSTEHRISAMFVLLVFLAKYQPDSIILSIV